MADARWRYAVQAGEIKPRKARTMRGPLFMVVTAPAKNGKIGPVPTRIVKAVLAESGIRQGKGKKPDLYLLYDLACCLLQLQRNGGKRPRRGLRGVMTQDLFETLQCHEQIRLNACQWSDLSNNEQNKLEKRLHHLWPVADRIAKSINQPAERLTSARRKLQTSMQHMAYELSGKTKS